MDTKRLILAMVLMTALIMGWEAFRGWMFARNPQWQRPGQQATTQPTTRPTGDGVAAAVGTTQPVALEAGAPAATTQPVTGGQAPVIRPAAGLRVAGGETEPRVVQIGTDQRTGDVPYRMLVELSTTGAGVRQVVLNEFNAAEEPDGDKPRAHYTYQQGFEEQLAATRPLATEAVTVNGQVLSLGSANWRVVEQGEDRAVFETDVLSGETPVARIVKTYQLAKRDDPSQGYQLDVTQRVENLSGQPLVASSALNGPVPPVREMVTMDDRQVIAGYNDEGRVVVRSHMLSAFEEDKATVDLAKDKNDNPYLWFGTSSVYFNAIVRPLDPKQVSAVSAGTLNPRADRDNREHRKVFVNFSTADLTLAAGAAADVGFEVFFGPKKRDLFGAAYYYDAPRHYYATLKTLDSGCAAWCAWDWLVNSLVWLLGVFYFLTRDWGLAIIGLVIIVRLLLHPLTKKSTVSMSKMQKMAPEMERLKKKYGDNKEELNRAMMQMYKEQGAGPILGCLPMFLQMPIWIALWSSLQSTFGLRQAPFLYGITWIDDLSKPDRLLEWDPVTLFFGWTVSGLNVLPVLLGVVFYLQMKMQPKPPTMTPEQAQQQKMMQWMTLLFPLFLYNGPSGLNLYILTSTTIGIIEMKRIRAHIKQQEELEKLSGPVVVDAGGTRQSRKFAKSREVNKEEPPKKGIWKWLADMQAKFEQIQREQDKRRKQGG